MYPSPADTRWRGLLLCAVDGTIMTVADSPANLAVYLKQRGGKTGGGSYPALRLLALVSCGTRAVIDGVHGRIADGARAPGRSVRTVGCFTDGHGRAPPAADSRLDAGR